MSGNILPYPVQLCRHLHVVLLLTALLSPLQSHAQTFDPRLLLSAGNAPFGTGIGDLDGDGRQDLLIGAHDDNKLSVFRNLGQVGTLSFAPKLDFSTGGHPQGLLTADFDGDGKLDVVTANAGGGGSITIYRNASTSGTISLVDRLDIPQNTAHRVASGDLDGDGKLDLAVTSNSAQQIRIYRNTSSLGSISFTDVRTLVTPGYANSVAVGDIDGDGRLDVLAPMPDADALIIYLNQSSGGSISFSPSGFFAGDAANGIGIAEMNGDTKVDIVISNPYADTVSLFLNGSSPGTLSLSRLDFPASDSPSDVALGDFDHDGRLDVSVSSDTEDVFILRNKQTPSGPSLELVLEPASGPGAFMPAVGDIDGDGHLDIVVSNHLGTTATVLRNVGKNPPHPGDLSGEVNPQYPIVVITHGWQPCDPFEGHAPPWVNTMKDRITEIVTEKVGGVNVLVFTWGEAFTGPCPPGPNLGRASAAVLVQARLLAGLLHQRLNACPPPGCNLHMIGHSFGSILNAYAARELVDLGHEIDQLTLLDPAITYTTFTAEQIRNLLTPWPKIKWVDNYIATAPWVDFGLAQVGKPILGAANFRINTTHPGIHDYYANTIPGGLFPPDQEGFYFSTALGSWGGFLPEDDRPDPIRWNLTIIRSAPVLPLPSHLETPSQSGWRTVTGNVHEELITTGGVTTPAIVLGESSDSAIDLPLTVPQEADILRLQLVFLEPGEDDWFTLSFDDEVFFTYRGDVFADESEPLVVPLEVPIANLKGRTGTLEARLNSSGGVNASFAVHSLELVELTDAPPPGYYDGLDDTSQGNLRATLHEVIDDHIRFPYTSSNTDSWDILELADEDPNNPSNILDVYKNASYTKVGGGNSNYDREHVWPNSYGFPDDGADNMPFSDCHALFLSDSSYNSSRSNNPFRTCSAACTEKPTDENNGKGGGSGVYPGNSNWRTGSGPTGTWETWIGRRGDVARALFYLDVRYEGGAHGVTGVLEPDLILTDDESLITTSGGVNASVAYMGMLSTLLDWHKFDPVDDMERNHNEIVASYQGNRSPFVDNPGWVTCAIGGDCGSFYTVTPCRVVDTRGPDGPYGGPALTSGTLRFFTIAGQCGIPATAEAISFNVTAVSPSAAGYITLYPGNQSPPTTSTVNFTVNLNRANNGTMGIPDGIMGVKPVVASSGQVHLVIDVNGYFD